MLTLCRDNEMKIVPFRATDALDLIRSGVIECGAQVSEPNGSMASLAEFYERESMSVTCILEGKVLFCAMIKPLWPGVAEVAALFDKSFSNHALSGCRAAREAMDQVFEIGELHRLQTTVRVDFAAGVRFAEWMGFEREGLAKRYSHDGVDAWYYAIVR